jgi:hypothetical protein
LRFGFLNLIKNNVIVPRFVHSRHLPHFLDTPPISRSDDPPGHGATVCCRGCSVFPDPASGDNPMSVLAAANERPATGRSITTCDFVHAADPHPRATDDGILAIAIDLVINRRWESGQKDL